jgi:hypothetical protein
MTTLEKLISVLSDPSTNARQPRAKSTHTCKICGQPVDSFRNAASKLEYFVSSISQACQYKYFRW